MSQFAASLSPGGDSCAGLLAGSDLVERQRARIFLETLTRRGARPARARQSMALVRACDLGHARALLRRGLRGAPAAEERSARLQAQVLEDRPAAAGAAPHDGLFVIYSTAVREVSPHLCWLRDFFAENGATIVEMEKAPPDYGFMIGSARHRAPHEEGGCRPRLTSSCGRGPTCSPGRRATAKRCASAKLRSP